jgi:uncharacterized protein YbdZ (MbtH family)
VKFPCQREGFLHELFEQTGPVCLVKRSKDGSQLHYEVVVLQQHRAREWPDGRVTPAGWHYPPSKQWGEAGWTYTDPARARRRYLSEGQKGGLKAAESINIAGHDSRAAAEENVRP